MQVKADQPVFDTDIFKEDLYLYSLLKNTSESPSPSPGEDTIPKVAK
jgi:hypothetical protein